MRAPGMTTHRLNSNSVISPCRGVSHHEMSTATHSPTAPFFPEVELNVLLKVPDVLLKALNVLLKALDVQPKALDALPKAPRTSFVARCHHIKIVLYVLSKAPYLPIVLYLLPDVQCPPTVHPAMPLMLPAAVSCPGLSRWHMNHVRHWNHVMSMALSFPTLNLWFLSMALCFGRTVYILYSKPSFHASPHVSSHGAGSDSRDVHGAILINNKYTA